MKLAEIKLTQNWQKLQDLIEQKLVGEIELYNAAGWGGSNIYYTEDAEQPTNKTFYKILQPQEGVDIAICSQDIWLRAEASIAKLMVSKYNEVEGE